MPKTKKWLWCFENQGEGGVHLHALTEVFFIGKTEFQEVGILKTEDFGKILMIDGDVQSTQLDEFVYHESLAQPALLLHPDPKNVLILGGGEGATLRECCYHSEVKNAVMVDIDGELVEMMKKYLPEWSRGAFNDPRTQVEIADAMKWLAESNRKFQVIISDLTEPLPDSQSYFLSTLEFFQEVKTHLVPDGIFAIQASVADLNRFELHCRLNATLSQVYKIVRPYCSRVGGFDTVWGFLLCSDELDPLSLSPEEINQRIKTRLQKPLAYYDGETHRHIFSLTKPHREALAKYTKPFRKSDMLIGNCAVGF